MDALTDDNWLRVAPFLPVAGPKGGRPWAGRGDHLAVRTGAAWRDLPEQFGPWITVYKRHRRFAADGTWDKVHAELLKLADAAGVLEWDVSDDSTVNRAHQHGTNLPRVTGGLRRITRISATSPLIMESAGHAAV